MVMTGAVVRPVLLRRYGRSGFPRWSRLPVMASRISPANARPAVAEQEYRYWYQWYFHTDRGRSGLAANRGELTRLLWRLWSPHMAFDEATLQATTSSFDNPDFVDVTIQSYRHRYGNAAGDPAYDALEARLAGQPAIDVPTIILHGEEDGVGPRPLPSPAIGCSRARSSGGRSRVPVIFCRGRRRATWWPRLCDWLAGRSDGQGRRDHGDYTGRTDPWRADRRDRSGEPLSGSDFRSLLRALGQRPADLPLIGSPGGNDGHQTKRPNSRRLHH